MANFDPNAFMNQQVTGAMSTVSTPVPEGEFIGVAEKVEVSTWSKKDGSASGLKATILWSVDDPAVSAATGRPQNKVRQDIMLDLRDDGQLAMGKGENVSLGKLREALDLNDPKKPFSFAMIQGRVGKVVVKHRVDGDAIYAEVKAVLKA